MWLKIMSQSEKLGEGKGHNYGWVVKGTDLFSKSGGQKINLSPFWQFCRQGNCACRHTFSGDASSEQR
jgi:hypothetical protein